MNSASVVFSLLWLFYCFSYRDVRLFKLSEAGSVAHCHLSNFWHFVRVTLIISHITVTAFTPVTAVIGDVSSVR